MPHKKRDLGVCELVLDELLQGELVEVELVLG